MASTHAIPTRILYSQANFASPSKLPARSGNSSFFVEIGRRHPVNCSATRKISFVDQILDYIEGGPKLRKWYGAPDLAAKDGFPVEDENQYPEDVVRDAILVTDGDSEIGQMVILSLIVKRARVKALVKDKKTATEAFGTYVESITGNASDNLFTKRALRGVRAIICPKEGFLSSVESIKGVEHVIVLSQLSVYRGSSGIQALMTENAKKLAEKDEAAIMAAGVPCTIVRAGSLRDTPGGGQGFNFEEGCAARGSLSKEDAATICVEALDVVPNSRFVFEVVNGEEKVSDWKECLTVMLQKSEGKLQ